MWDLQVFALRRRALPVAAILLAITSPAILNDAHAQGAGFVPPPRTISDITAILDQQKPDPEGLARRQREAELETPAAATKAQLLAFLMNRARARSELGRGREAIADAEAAIGQAESVRQRLGIDQFLVSQYSVQREPEKALRLLNERAADHVRVSSGMRINLGRYRVRTLLGMGDIAGAERDLKALEDLVDETRSKASLMDIELYSGVWGGNLELARGNLLATRGLWKDAEIAFVKAEAGFRDAAQKRPRWPSGPSAAAQELIANCAAASSILRPSQSTLARSTVPPVTSLSSAPTVTVPPRIVSRQHDFR